MNYTQGTFYLEEHPPASSQGAPLTQELRVIMLHTTQSMPDYVLGDDNAEKMAAYLQRRSSPGCYHTVVDRDSRVDMWNPRKMRSWGCRYGFNHYAAHLSMATKAEEYRDDETWDLDDEGKGEYALQAARVIAEWSVDMNIPLVSLTREQAMGGARGFITHAAADPWRRFDPGFSAREIEMLLAEARRLQQLVNAPPQTSDGRGQLVDYVMVPAGKFNRETYRYPMWKYYTEGTVIPMFDAPFHGDLSYHDIAAPITKLLPTSTGSGYWLIGSDGGIFTFGDAWYPGNHQAFMKDYAPKLVGDIVTAILITDSWIQMIGSDGGVFDFHR